ncbi:hypothetical protein ES705_27048 [subsurface metagenome]
MDVISFIGILRLTQIKDKYRCNFTGQNRLYWLLNKQKLTEMDLGQIELPDFKLINKTKIDDFYFEKDGEKAYCFPPVQNTKVYDKYSYNESGYDVLNYLQRTFPSGSQVYIDWYYVPAYFLNFLVKYTLGHLGLHINYNILDDSKFKNSFLLSSYIITDQEFTEVEGSTNQFDVDSIIINEQNKVVLQLEEKSMTPLTPDCFVKLYDLSIEEHYNFEGRIVQVLERDSENYQIVTDIDKNHIKASSGSVGKIRKMKNNYVLDDIFEMNKTMPNITPLELINTIEDLFGVLIVPSEAKNEINIYGIKEMLLDNKFIDITAYAGKTKEKQLNNYTGYTIAFTGKKDDYFNERVRNLERDHTICDPVQSIGNLPVNNNKNGDVRYIIDENNYYKWNAAGYGSRRSITSALINTGNWAFFSEGYWLNNSGDNNLEINIKAVPILAGYGSPQAYNNLIPRIDVPFNSSVTKEYTDIGVRVAFLNKLSNGYPVASVRNDDVSLEITGEDGLYEQCYKEFIEWKLNRHRECKCSVYWPYQLLSLFHWERKYRIKNTNYFIMEINLSQKGTEQIKFKDTILARV